MQESVLDSVVARLKLRLAGMKTIPLQSEAHRTLLDTAVQEAVGQGATVSQTQASFHLCAYTQKLSDDVIHMNMYM